MELFGSNSSDEQLTGVRILRQFAVNEWYSGETLEKIIINVPVVERSHVLETVVQLVKMLVSTTENTGKCLRREISKIVFTVSNGRDVLRHGSSRENWWNGGVLKELFNIFFKTYGDDGNQGCVRIAAGKLVEALEVPSIRVNVASL
ncbi:unnamed protein product [Brassica oleracea var. botrytis]